MGSPPRVIQDRRGHGGPSRPSLNRVAIASGHRKNDGNTWHSLRKPCQFYERITPRNRFISQFQGPPASRTVDFRSVRCC